MKNYIYAIVMMIIILFGCSLEYSQDDDVGFGGIPDQMLDFGVKTGEFNGINIYSNGKTYGLNPDSVYSTYGYQWQCVEFINRYYTEYLGHKNMKGTGNAIDYYNNYVKNDLLRYSNDNENPPKVNDILCFSGSKYGHVAIVREVGSDYVIVINQNYYNNYNDDKMYISMKYENNKYNVGSVGATKQYPCQGWLRKKEEFKPNKLILKPIRHGKYYNSFIETIDSKISYAYDDKESTCAWSGPTTSISGKSESFEFDSVKIPDGAVISGIEIEIYGSKEKNNTLEYISLRHPKNGWTFDVEGSARQIIGINTEPNRNMVLCGGKTDKWGLEWKAEDLKTDEFSVLISNFYTLSTGSSSFYLFDINLIIYLNYII